MNRISYPFDISSADVNVDLLRVPKVDVIADVQHMPFVGGAFNQTFCFHVLQHVENPALALKELVRVTSQLVELEVPFWLGKGARGKSLVSSFKAGWFHAMLRHTTYCLRILYEFPLSLFIHVWIYPNSDKKRRERII